MNRIKLSGNETEGYGFKATAPGFAADGEPREWRTATDALHLACLALEDAGFTGTVVVVSVDDDSIALTDVCRPCDASELKWTPICADAAERAERQAWKRCLAAMERGSDARWIDAPAKRLAA